MTTTKTAKQEIYLVVTEERSNQYDGYFHLRARFRTQLFEDHQWIPYGLDDQYGWEGKPLLSDLEVSCQGDRSSQLRAGEGESGAVYGFDSVYRDVYSVGLDKVRRMAKVLEKLDKGLAKLQEQRGRVRSFGEYAGRVAEILGAVGIGIERKRDRLTYGDGRRWNWLTLGEGVNEINHRIWLWAEEAREKAAVKAEASPSFLPCGCAVGACDCAPPAAASDQAADYEAEVASVPAAGEEEDR